MLSENHYFYPIPHYLPQDLFCFEKALEKYSGIIVDKRTLLGCTGETRNSTITGGFEILVDLLIQRNVIGRICELLDFSL